MYTFRLPIGDWSNDGHGQCEKFLIESNKSPEEILDIYNKMDEIWGFSTEVSEYEENEMSDDFVDMLEGHDFDKSKYMSEDNIIEPKGLALLFIDLLENFVEDDDSIKLRIVDDNVVEFNNHFAMQVKGKHGERTLDLPGYGLFD